MTLSKKKIAIVFVIFSALYGIIALNLFFLQMYKRSFFTHLAHQQYNVTITQRPPRAPIFDRNKECLALNRQCVSAFIVPKALHDMPRVSSFLAQHFPEAHAKWQKNPARNFMYIQRKLSPEQQALIAQANIPDIQLVQESNRFYPTPSASPIIGMTSIDNEGTFGIERIFNDTLTGRPSVYTLEKDARSGYFHFKKEMQKKGNSGTPITLTLDSTLQFLASQELQDVMNTYDAKAGAVIIMNPDNGDILSMVSAPHFDPNNTRTLNIEHTKNIPINDVYEFGSVLKTFAGLAALQEGVVQKDELIDCKGKKTAYVDGRKINTVIAHGIIPFTDVIAYSNNIGIAQVAKRLQEKLYDHYVKLGFGQKVNICLPGEQCGFVNHPANWSKHSIISLSYGYELSATMLQLARAFSIIANDGHMIQPRLRLDEPIVKSAQLYSDESIATIKEILQKTSKQGTARRSSIKGYTIMSKTGTANLLTNGKYDDTRNIYTCAGIVQKDTYKRIIVAFVKEAKHSSQRLYASTVAAPLFEKVAQQMLIHERIV